MAGAFEPELATVAFCWRVQRRDGVCLGFTGHDRDLMIGGIRYRSAPGMLPSAITLSGTLDADALEVAGALTSNAIRGDDLAAGRWDGAAVRVFAVDWEAPEAGEETLAEGELGEVTIRGGGFEARLRGIAAQFERPVVEQTSPDCRAQLGDKRCRVDMAGQVRITRVVSVPGEESVEVEQAAGANAYGYGRLRWIGGRNSGLESAIRSSAGAVLTLREPPAHAAEVGDMVEISEGCDRRFETCAGRFQNALNFRGEPHLPGMDLLTRYPGA
jgi:uncharacterized phage protein (TIGR02218 family)